METKIAVMGLGYVGLPLAVEFGKKYNTIGFDINKKRIKNLEEGNDYNGEMSKEDLVSPHLVYSSDKEVLRDCDVFIVAVPTPVDQFNRPDLNPLINTSNLVGSVMKKGAIVIYESTVYPGCTEDDCVPVLEKASGYVYNKDFFCGYSPERINPGDKERTLTKIKKVTSGSTPKVAEVVDSLYASILENGTHRASSIKVAEASKIIENSQRDVNIAFVNEIARIFHLIGVDTNEVLDAACTKWNFLNFRPGLVGGHCLLPETEVLMSDGTVKAIKDVKEGESVVSGKGNIRKVNKVISHEYTGDVISIKGTGMSYELKTTCDHEVFASVCTGNKIDEPRMIKSSELVCVNDKEFHKLYQCKSIKEGSVLIDLIKKEVEPDYNGLVYDLEVEEDHSFIANTLVVSNCISIDPYYLIHKSQSLGYIPELMISSRRINDDMGNYVATEVLKLMLKHNLKVYGGDVLICGFTFKENCPDIRNTRVFEIHKVLTDFGCNVHIYDPLADVEEIKREYSLEATNELPQKKFESVVIAVSHKEFKKIDFKSLLVENGVCYDIKAFLPKDKTDGRL